MIVRHDFWKVGTRSPSVY